MTSPVLTWQQDEEALSVLYEALLQLASEFREELVARRGRPWSSEDDERRSREESTTAGEDVREAMRLDSPLPLGARIFLADDFPSSLTFPLSSTSSSSLVFFWRLAEDAGRPTVEN